MSSGRFQLREEFAKYLDSFKPFLLSLFQKDLKLATELLSEICYAVNDKISLYCEDVVNLLVSNLNDKRVSLTTKYDILTILGDLAMTIGPKFNIYMNSVLHSVMTLQTEFDEARIETPEFLHIQTEFHKNVLKTYRRILFCLHGDDRTRFELIQTILPCISNIIQVISKLQKFDYIENFAPKCVEEISDIISIIGPNKFSMLEKIPIATFVGFALKSESDEIRHLALSIKAKFKLRACDDIEPRNFLRRSLDYVIKTFSSESIQAVRRSVN